MQKGAVRNSKENASRLLLVRAAEGLKSGSIMGVEKSNQFEANLIQIALGHELGEVDEGEGDFRDNPTFSFGELVSRGS